MTKTSSNLEGISFLVLAVLIISLQSIAVKWMGGDYSFTTHMMGLAALPLADIESIRFSAPMMITLLFVVVLGEKVGLRRWLALVVGFVGVLLIVRPGSAAFNLGSIFILIFVS